MLDAGKLRHRLTILELTSEQDSDTGEMQDTWSELATVWGSFTPFSVRERLTAASVNDQTSVRAVIRYRSDILPEMRISFREKTYEIVGPPLPDADSGLEYLTLMLREIETEEEVS
jgi:SPP1 family predicted phage head-tail adaptor